MQQCVVDPKTTLFCRPLSRDWLVWGLLLIPVIGGWRIGVHALHDTGSWIGGRPNAPTRFLVVAAALVAVVLAVALVAACVRRRD